MRNNGEQGTYKTNSDKRPDEILAEIDRTRDEMDRTLSAIEHRLTPGQLVDQGLDYLRHSGANEFVQNLGGTAKQNPLPVALTAIGIAWLMALGRQPARPNHGSTSSSGLREGIDSMRDRAGNLTDATRQQWDRARGGVDYLVREQPLALGAIGLAVGAVVAAMAPRTQKEEQLMGEASRNVMEKAKEAGSQQIEKAQQAVQQASKPQPPPQPAPSPKQSPGAAGPDKKGAW